MRSAVLLVLAACKVLAQPNPIGRIQECKSHCPKGLHCRTAHYLSFEPCKSTPGHLNSSVFHKVNISTGMKCEERRKCSLQLKVNTEMQINNHIQGVSMCTVSAGMLERCQTLTIPRAARESLAGSQVEIQNDCLDVRAGQDVHVILKTVPNYCDLTWSKRYHVQECSNEDLRNNVPECITGKIQYTVDEEKKELTVNVSDMLEHKDYHLRLCHRGYTCSGTGAYSLIKSDNPFKSATFQYSRPLPCLCIEGWSSMLDASRIQVCPFSNSTEEMWSGVTFDLEEEVLSWEPICPTKAVVTLCQRVGENVCLDLVNSTQAVNGRKVMFSKVDPHPKLCMKFTTGEGSWVKCPFAGGNFPAWNLMVTSRSGLQQAVLSSQVRAEISLALCRKAQPSDCDEVTTVPLGNLKYVAVNLTRDACNPGVCIQARRVDVEFSAPVLHCHFQCSDEIRPVSRSQSWDLEWLFGLALVFLAMVMLSALIGNNLLTVYQKRRTVERQDSACLFEQRAALPNFVAVTILHAADDESIAHLARDLEKFLTSLNVPAQLADINEGWLEQALLVDVGDVFTILLWSDGCTKHIHRLALGKHSLHAHASCPASGMVKVDVVTYDSLTPGVPSWLNAVPLGQVKDSFTQLIFTARVTSPDWPLFVGYLKNDISPV